MIGVNDKETLIARSSLGRLQAFACSLFNHRAFNAMQVNTLPHVETGTCTTKKFIKQ